VTEAADLVRYELDGGVARITIDRAEARNALTAQMRDRLTALLEEASADLHVRVVLLTGKATSFCTGADLRGGQSRAPRPTDAPDMAVGDVARLIRRGWQRLIEAVLDCEKPVVAAVNGTAAGAGAHLALACDLVIAAESARFIEVFVRRGIIPDAGGAYLLARLVGPQRAKELLFFGDDVPADRAVELGLVNRVVPDADLDTAVEEWVQRLVVAPTRALAQTKALVNRALESDRAGAFAEEASAQELIQGTADAQEGIRSYVERRQPKFHGW
jgi:2-(1,2-epoxy-1,2-dihydrophenyl)acetyl-CoA isomerase